MTIASAKERVVELAAFAEPVVAHAASEANASASMNAIARNTALLKDVPVTLEIRLGQASISVQDLFALKDGSVVRLDRTVDDPVDVMLNGRVVARGQLVASGDQFGVRVTEINTADV